MSSCPAPEPEARGCVRAWAHLALTTADPRAKAQIARTMARSWQAGDLTVTSVPLALPDRPSRPAEPRLAPPGEMKRRRLHSLAGRRALLHAVAHIELNAIDLACDMIVRFISTLPGSCDDQRAFAKDWTRVAADEARHFGMIADRLEELDSHYGALPAHDGLWEAALATRHDIAARLAIAPLVLEARGLDVTPAMAERLDAAKDALSGNLLRVIYDEEIDHVACGKKWFDHVCAHRHTDPRTAFHMLVRMNFAGLLKRPFNHEARARAGLEADWYEALAAPMDTA